ncbi:Uncharacterized protein SCG7086_CW_00030 [Chlamydiales bacterium SCGC AG-110-P3]|nr:Uncharacterized protein SCG7086_CW_00030 [Chlamydiales bacterium SCGC AG-110-P3]
MELGISLDPYPEKAMKTDFLIIGGGVAGLSSANCLAEAGADVTLLESGTYPVQKICGEFLSPEAIPILEGWDIAPASEIATLKFVTPKQQWCMELPQRAATLPRYVLDGALARRAELYGAQVKTGAQVENVEVPKFEGQNFNVTLTSGERWSSPTLLLSTGRLVSSLTKQKPPKFCYIGAKAHFKGIDIPKELVMHLVPGAYFGMAPISDGSVNVAGIIACTAEQAQDPKATLYAFFERSETQCLTEVLDQGSCLFEDWMVGPIPEFGMRDDPRWPNTLLIGDAAGVIPPATGNGLAMGLTSGILAAEYALKGDLESYQACWKKTYGKRISRGVCLHRFFLSSYLVKAMPLVNRLFPAIPDYLFRLTRK